MAFDAFDESVDASNPIGRPLGTVYCDMFPRDGKAPLTAHFTIQCGRRARAATASAEQLPIVLLSMAFGGGEQAAWANRSVGERIGDAMGMRTAVASGGGLPPPPHLQRSPGVVRER